MLDYNGEIKSMSEWAEQYGLRIGTLWARINVQKLNIEDSLNLPIKYR